MNSDKATHKTISIVKKYKENINEGETLQEFEKRCMPYEVKKIDGNSLIEAGVDILWTLACGDSATNYGSSNANIDIYISSAWDSTGTFDSGSYPTYSI